MYIVIEFMWLCHKYNSCTSLSLLSFSQNIYSMTSISMKNSKGMLYHIVDSKKLEEFSSFPCMYYLYSNIVNIVHILQLVTVIYYHNKKISR